MNMFPNHRCQMRDLAPKVSRRSCLQDLVKKNEEVIPKAKTACAQKHLPLCGVIRRMCEQTFVNFVSSQTFSPGVLWGRCKMVSALR